MTTNENLLERLGYECKHSKVMPSFDPQASHDLDASEVRKRWPRFMGRCPDCDFNGILYASVEHYIAGDW